MKLVSFSVKNYRSISKAYKLPLSNYTVIIGPNNEGKSNILRALALSFSLLNSLNKSRFFPRRLSATRSFNRRFSSSSSFEGYDWERDYPVNLQSSNPKGSSEFTLEFEFNDDDFKEFKKRTKIKLRTNLKAKISIGKEQLIRCDFLMKGKGKTTLNENRQEIAEFINSRLLLQYIPSIRTSELSIDVVENLLSKELYQLEENKEFKDLINAIEELRQPIINNIETNLKKSIRTFIPEVREVLIRNKEEIGSLISSSCEVYINDGTVTKLDQKGDGVISLTAISLIQYFSRQGSLGRGLILLLEEPESHLHPEAIRNLKHVLSDISNNSQVIITTHSPIMIDRQNIDNNIIVARNKATPAKNIAEIRKSLGIVLSDNLSSAFLVLLVEGESDKKILKTWLEGKSGMIKNAIEDGYLVLDCLDGATNISYKASLYKNLLCNVVVYVDNDQAGKNSVKNAQSKGILRPNECFLSICEGMKESEVEDIVAPTSYKEQLLNKYGVDINNPMIRNTNNKWSDRVLKLFQKNGKPWDDEIKMQVKSLVADAVAENGLESLDTKRGSSIDSLKDAIEKILNRR